MDDTTSPPEAPSALPPGDYAIVECFGHTTLVGRVVEVERFGTKMLQIEPLFAGQLLPPVLQGGASIYRLTPCTAEVALASGPTSRWQLPAALRDVVPAALLPAPAPRTPPEFDLISPDDGAEEAREAARDRLRADITAAEAAEAASRRED